MNNTEIISSCPLCGSESKHVKAGSGGHRILCWNDDCECSSGYFCSKEEAIFKWNQRSTAQCLHQIQEPSASEQASWHAGLDEGRAQAGFTVSNAETPQARPAAVNVADERAAFEAWAKSEDMSIGSDCDGYIHSNTAAASLAWQARAALAATTAAQGGDE